MALSESACAHGEMKPEDIIREAGFKFAGIEILWTFMSANDVDKALVSKFVTNAFKFLFDSSSEAGKTIQTVLH